MPSDGGLDSSRPATCGTAAMAASVSEWGGLGFWERSVVEIRGKAAGRERERGGGRRGEGRSFEN